MARDDGRLVTPEGVARRTAVESGRATVALSRLWIGLLLAPTIWLAGELIGYYLAARSCESRVGGVPLLGTAWPSVTHVVFELVAAIVAAIGLLVAFRNWRDTQSRSRPGDPPILGREHFMAFAGVVGSSLFLFGILLFAFSGFVVNACSQAR